MMWVVNYPFRKIVITIGSQQGCSQSKSDVNLTPKNNIAFAFSSKLNNNVFMITKTFYKFKFYEKTSLRYKIT